MWSELNTGSEVTTSAVDFELELTGCPVGGIMKTETSKYGIDVSVADALDLASVNDKGLLSNTEVAGAAQNVSVQLLKGDKLLNISNAESAPASFSLSEAEIDAGGSIKIPLKARLHANSSVKAATAGKIQAAAAFTFEYK